LLLFVDYNSMNQFDKVVGKKNEKPIYISQEDFERMKLMKYKETNVLFAIVAINASIIIGTILFVRVPSHITKKQSSGVQTYLHREASAF